ncbi:hypothetical protein Fot_28894 [Forsythia ovata]|uniref:Uncharacterized protein n=1 Tax=Forsythia ovata TaxID=205694 RepID=A0ABD1TQP8_9LAMI
MVSSSSFIPLATEVTSGMPSVPFSVGPVSPSENFGRPGKMKVAADNKETLFVPGKEMDGVEGFRRTRRGCGNHALEIEDRTPHDRGASRPLFLLLLVNTNTST